MGHIPVSVEINDGRAMVVAETTNVGRQTLYADSTLKHYRIDGVDAYCIQSIDMSLKTYRCFKHENGVLTAGMDPNNQNWEPLPVPVNIRTANQ